jgi:hypothetical protein
MLRRARPSRPSFVSASVLAVALSATGCGSPEADDGASGLEQEGAFETYDYAADVGLALAPVASSGESYEAYVGAPLGVTSVDLCPGLRPEDCRDGAAGRIAADLVVTRATRLIFKARSPLALTSGVVVAVALTDAQGARSGASLRFDLVGGPGGVGGQKTRKAVFMTGDDSINAFDNARKTLKDMFVRQGIRDENVRQLSRRQSEQTGDVKASSATALKDQLASLNVVDGDVCLAFMTSHGSRDGFYLRGQATLSPKKYAEILDQTCGTRPTVVLVSACYSGVFIKEPTMLKDNRVILTAARHDRTSFGCGAENQYTYWDNCLIDHLPTAKTWNELYTSVAQCIKTKEGGGGFTPSEPQAYFGAAMKDFPLPGQ